MRRSRACGLVFASLIICVPAAAASATPTRIVKISPVTASDTLKPGYTIVATHYGGTCEAGSDVMAGVYRCFAGDGVYDPCWAESNTRVGCLPTPWSHHIVRINVNTALEVSPGGPFYVWGVRLSSGQRCVAAQGAHDSFDHHVVNFACDNDYKLVLLDEPNEHRNPWRIREAHYHRNGNRFSYGGVAKITLAWYGLPSTLPSVSPAASSAQRCSEATAGSLTYDVWIDSGSPTYVNCSTAADVFAAYYSQYSSGPNANVGVTADGTSWFCGTADESLAPLLAVCYYPNSLNTTAQIASYPPGALDPG